MRILEDILSFFEKHNRICLVIALIIAVFIFYMSSLVFPPGVAGLGIKAIVYHFGIFALLNFFLLIGVKGEKEDNLFILLVIAVSLFYAVTDEFHQLFVPGRHGGLFDVAVDSIGILSASLFYSVVKFRR